MVNSLVLQCKVWFWPRSRPEAASRPSRGSHLLRSTSTLSLKSDSSWLPLTLRAGYFLIISAHGRGQCPSRGSLRLDHSWALGDLKCACAQLFLAGEGAAANLPGLGGVYNPEASWRLSSWSDLRPFGSWGEMSERACAELTACPTVAGFGGEAVNCTFCT